MTRLTGSDLDRFYDLCEAQAKDIDKDLTLDQTIDTISEDTKMSWISKYLRLNNLSEDNDMHIEWAQDAYSERNSVDLTGEVR